MSIYTEEAERRAIRGRCEKCQRKAAPGHRTCGRHPADALSKSAPRVVAECPHCKGTGYITTSWNTEECSCRMVGDDAVTAECRPLHFGGRCQAFSNCPQTALWIVGDVSCCNGHKAIILARAAGHDVRPVDGGREVKE